MGTFEGRDKKGCLLLTEKKASINVNRRHRPQKNAGWLISTSRKVQPALIGHVKHRQCLPLLFFQWTLTLLFFSTWSTSTAAFFNLVDVDQCLFQPGQRCRRPFYSLFHHAPFEQHFWIAHVSIQCEPDLYLLGKIVSNFPLVCYTDQHLKNGLNLV